MDRMKRFARKTVSYVVAMTMVFSMMQMSVFAQGETTVSEPTTTAVSDQNAVTAETENNNANANQTNEESPPASNEATESTKVEEKTDANKSSGEDPSAAQKAAEEKAKAEKEAAEKAEAEKKAAEEKAAAEKKAAEEKAKAEKEAAEKAEAEKKAAENAMPAQTFTGSTSQLKVTASVNANVFPNGTEMKVTPVSSTVAKNIAKKTVDDGNVVTKAIGADITFFKDGKELQPADNKAVYVSMTLNKSLDGQDYKVVHQKDTGTIEKMNASVNDHKATFNAKSFSIYVISAENPVLLSTYNFYDGDTIISEYTQKIKAGDTLKKPKSPEKTGYKFLGWATTKGATTPDFNAFKEYSKTDIDGKEHNIYAVFEEVHYVFFMDKATDDARVFTTKEGKEGTKVSTTDVKLDLASDQSVTGWYSDQGLTHEVEDTFTLGTSDIRLYPKIESGKYITFKTGKNGSYIEPKFYAAKENVTEESLPTPTRKGYTFKHWATKENGSKYVTGNALSDDITLYAVWEANDTNYSVVFWQQSIDDKPGFSTDQKTYKVESSVSRTAKTGDTVSVTKADKNKGYTGFTFNKADSSKTVTADGKTTLNVYYDRRKVTFTFNFPSGSKEYVYGGKTYTGLYGQKFDNWPSYVTNKRTGEEIKALWSDGKNKTTYLDAFIPPDLTNFSTVFDFSYSGKATINYHKESLSGSYDDKISVGANVNGTFYITDKFTGFKAHAYSYAYTSDQTKWSLLDDANASGVYKAVEFYDELHIYFKRNTYNLEYYNYDHEDKTVKVKYESPLSQYANYTPTRPSSLDEGYKFRGWYKDEACTEKFDFGATMPAHGIKLYAKWAADPVDVKVHLSLKNDETTTLEDREYASTISLSDLPKVIDAEGETLVEGDNGHTVTVPENYHWIGWATKSNDSYTLYNFNNELHSDLELYPYYINTSKFIVKYSAGTGKGTVTDDKKYAENAYADVKSGSGLTAPDGSMFLNWQLQKYVDGELTGTDAYYYPGDKIKITGNIQLVAHYIPLPTKVNLLYYANNSSSSDAVKASNNDLENNAQLIIANGSNVAKPKVSDGVKAIFDHWNTKPDDSGISYTAGDKVGIDDKDMPNELYAQWRYEVTIFGQSDLVTYNGEKQSVTGIKKDSFTIEGQIVKIDDVTAKAEGTDVGEYATTFTFGKSYTDQAKVINGFKVKVETKPGTLTITPNETNIKITLKNASKVYDGKALTSKDIDVTDLPEGYKVHVETKGSQLDVGESSNEITSYTITKDGNDVTKGFTKVEVINKAKLTVTKRPVTLKSESASKEFDGTALTRPDVTITAGDFVKGEVESVEATGSITKAGTTTNTIQIHGVAGKYKEDNYKITKDEGTLTITKIAKKVTFIAASDSKEYDGTPLTNTTVTTIGLSDGYDFSASAKGSVTHVKEDEVYNVVDRNSVHIYKDGEDVTDQFNKIEYTNGKLSITQRTLTLTSASDTKAYDGTPLTKNVVTYDAARILNNDIHDIKATGSQTDVGSSDNTISYTIKDDVKDDYKVEEELGLLTVTQSEKKIAIKADDANKIYDGTPLTSDSFTVINGLDTTIFKVTADSHGSITDAGYTNHTIDNVKISKDGKDVTGWFTHITTEPGLLTVQPRPVTITTGSASKEFDGTPLTNDKITIGDMGFVDQEATAYTTGTITEVGSTDNTYEIVKGEGYKDGNYAISNNLGTLTIKDNEKTEITITAKSANKTYDGTPLTAGYEVTGLNEKLFTIEVTTKGSITNVGTAKNVIASYIIRNNDGKDVTEAFKTVKKADGTLTINKRNVILTSESKSKQFDGHSLTAKDVTVSGDGFVDGEVEDLKATGTITYPGSVTNTIEYTEKENFKAGNYTIKKNEGTLTITANSAKIVVTPGSISRKYDGTALTYDHGTVTGVPDGFTYELHTKGSITHTGTVDNEVDTFVIKKDDKDVTDFFDSITYNMGTLTITPREVTITSGSQSFVYDGKKHTYDHIKVTGDAILDKDIKAIHATGEITKAGSQVNTIEITPTENFVERDYTFNKVEGILTVTKNADEVVLTANSATKVYDGTPLINKKFTTDNLPDGFKAYVTVSGSITDAGKTDNTITAYKIMKDGEDVTDQFDKITTVNGTLTVNKRDVTITSESATKEYDGQPLTNAGVHVTGEIINDEIYAIVATGTQTDVGQSENSISYETSKDFKASNYNLTVHPGTLTVTKNTTAKVVIQAASASKMYDGQALEKAVATTTGLPDGITAKVTVEGKITHYGTKANLVTDYQFYKGDQNVTNWFNTPEVNDGILKITKRSVTLRSASDEKEYDGTPLTNETVTISGDGFVEGEVKEVKAIGSITDVGSTENTIRIEKNDGYDPLDYTIEENPGTLTITQNTTAKVKVTADSASKVYDGQALTKDTYKVTGLPEAFQVKATVSGSIMNVKDSPAVNKLSEIKIFKGDQDVTKFFKHIDHEDGSLTIMKRHVVIESGNAKRAYNGSPLTNDKITVSGDGFVKDEANAKATGTITEVGTTANTIKIEEHDGYLASNYDIELHEGTLEITPYTDTITIKAASQEKLYDGTPLTDASYDVTGLPKGFTAKVTIKGEITNAGTVKNKVTAYTILKDDQEVTDQFSNVKVIDGTLTINRRHVTLTSETKSKQFDGTPLTAPDVKVTGDGFVKGEVEDLKATGSITKAGSIDNPITYTKTKAFHEDNYVIKEDIGTLTVKKIAKEVTITSNNASKTYDGIALTNKTYTADGLPNGFIAKAEITGTITNAGSTKNTIKSVVIMIEDKDVTDQFDSITTKEGLLTVNKRQVVLTSASASREYNGLPLTRPTVDMTGDGFVKGEVTDVKATGSITEKGKVINTITYQTHDAFNKENYTITKQEGTLEITASHAKIHVRAASDEKVYDGTPLTNATTTIENLPEGFTYKATVKGTVTHVDEGTVDNKITEFHIYKGEQDVTNQFDAITHMDGTLKITARPLTMTSASDEKDYDGIALANNKVTVKGKIFNDEVYDITATGAQIEVGTSANTIVYKMTKHAEKDYAITLEEGLLTVNPHTAVITVTAGSDAKVYDGKALTSDTFTVEGLPDNLRAYVTTDGSATNVGDKGENKVNTVVIMDGMTDVTRYFANIKTVSGQLTITPRNVTLKSESDHKVYDGKALTRPEVKISGQGFVAGEATAKAVGTIKKIGSVPNKIELETTDAYKEKNYNLTYDLGTLTILANENAVVVNGSSVSKTYDGKALSSDKADVILPEGFENYKAEVKMTGTITNAGKIANKVADVIIRDEDGNDVTDQFKNITKNDGYLEVTPRKVTLTSESVTRAYDGTPLTAKHVTVTGDGFVDGEVSDLKATGSITEVGTTSNAISFQKNDAYKDKNYIITKKPGSLTITTAQVIMHITAASDEKVYDGQSLTNDGYTVAGVLPGMHIEATIKGEITNAGETENKVTAYRIMKGDQDVTDFFNTDDEHMMITDGTLTVKKRPVTLTSATLKKAYDGTALTNGDHQLKVTAGSYVEGESFKAGFTGRQLLVGSSDNTFTLSNHTAKLGNYDVKKEYGQLTVTDDVDDDKVVTKSHDAKEYKLGDTIHFEIKIKNIYDEVKTLKVTELPGVKITSDIPETLSAGEEITLKATYIVTEEDIKSQQFKNKVDVSLGKTYKGTDEVPEPEIDDAKPKLKITKTAEQKEYKLGDTITYKIHAKNTGNLTLTNIVVKDDLTKSSWTIAKLLPGETSQDLIATYKVTESDIKVGKIVNVATVDHIDDPTPDNPDDPAPEVTPGKETVDTEEKNPHITITKKADEKKAYKLGETIHYTIHATNDGNLTLTNIVIRDDLTNQQWTIRSLAPHQTSQDFTATYVVTEKDIKNGHVANVATMKDVDDPTPDDPTDPDPKDEPGKETVDTEDKNPHLTIIKKADDTKKYKLGETVTYTISAINDGNLTLTNIKLEDALTGDTWTIKKLAPQATSDEHVVTYTVTEKDIIAGKIKNIVTMKDVDDPTPEDPNDPDPKDNPGEKTVETEDKHPHLTITKQADTSKQYTLGDTITYTIKAKNDGNLTLTNIILKDDLTGDTFTIDSLKPQEESSDFTVNYKVTQQDVNKGKVTNVATVNKVDDPTPDDPTDPDPEVTPGKEEVDITKTNPSVTVTKKTTSTPKDGKAYQLGETITYEITVKNDGNLPLSAFKLHDDMTNENFDVKASKPGDTQSFTTSYKVQEADIVKGKVINNATVDTATLEDPTPDNKDDEVKITDGKTEDNTEASHPAVVITKTTTSSPASASGYEEGDTISYLITATNTGNLTLTNVVVEDPLTGGKWAIEKLSPNAQETFVTTYVVKALDVTRGNVVNTATVTSSEDPDPQKDPEVTSGTVTTPTSKTTIIDESGDGTMPTQNTPEKPTIATPATEESGSGKQATQNTPDTDTSVEKETVPTYNTDNTTPTVVKTTTYDTGTAPTTTTEAVKTGDETEITMQMMLMSIALITLLGVLIATRKKKENRN
ncbi:MAG: InlB B-repeat-containing protein [Intestinibaculum porci]|uniref:DUF7507 domain-containing protein n=1 Tax=Intestinibaculum porci TaxID=2487118 RepID=UPI003EFE0B65